MVKVLLMKVFCRCVMMFVFFLVACLVDYVLAAEAIWCLASSV
jgi:hypothetical protein